MLLSMWFSVYSMLWQSSQEHTPGMHTRPIRKQSQQFFQHLELRQLHPFLPHVISPSSFWATIYFNLTSSWWVCYGVDSFEFSKEEEHSWLDDSDSQDYDGVCDDISSWRMRDQNSQISCWFDSSDQTKTRSTSSGLMCIHFLTGVCGMWDVDPSFILLISQKMINCIILLA